MGNKQITRMKTEMVTGLSVTLLVFVRAQKTPFLLSSGFEMGVSNLWFACLAQSFKNCGRKRGFVERRGSKI